MPTIIPSHRTVISVFPVYQDHQWMHNGIMHYTHAPAPRNYVLKRCFAYQAGLWCVDHKDHEQPKPFLDRGVCQRCKGPLSDIPFWQDEQVLCEEGKGYALYTFYDTQQFTRDWSSDKEIFMARPVSAQSVVTDFINTYTNGIVGISGTGLRPGIIPILGDEPTDAEYKEAIDLQTAMFTKLFNDAITDFSAMRYAAITDTHRLAATWLGREDVPFVQKIEQRSVKRCPACDELISAKARKCKVCSEDLEIWYKSRGIRPDKLIDPFLYEESAQWKKVKAAKEELIPA